MFYDPLYSGDATGEWEILDAFVPARPVSAFAGLVFGGAWWLVIDAYIYQIHGGFTPELTFQMVIPGLFSTFSLCVLVFVPGHALANTTHRYRRDLRCIFLCSFFIHFCAIFASLGILVTNFAPESPDPRHAEWPGIALFLQNALILMSAMLIKQDECQ